MVQQCRKDKKIVAVILRVDSPGGEATASDLMWREIKKLAEKKPVVASMGDVAASGILASCPMEPKPCSAGSAAGHVQSWTLS